ncbi:hypothetical protein ACP70R_024419 [Stipagrostis hirtigluma subsp. patula]
MLRQSSGRSHRSRKLRPRNSFQALLLVAVGIWLVYQLTRSYGRRRALAAEADENDGMDDGEPARRRLGRKGFVDFAGHASDDDIVGIRDESEVGGGGGLSDDDALSEAAAELEGGDSDEDDQVADEDGDDHGDDADGGLATDEEEGGNDFQAENGSGEGELTTALGETRNGLNGSIVPPVNTTSRLHDGVAVQMVNATDVAAERTAEALRGSAPKNTSAVDQVGGVPGAENEKHTNMSSADEKGMFHQNWTTASASIRENHIIHAD